MTGPKNWNQDVQQGGAKYDQGKPRVDLLPARALLALAELYGQGAKKYADRNWEEGIDQSRILGALGRHYLRYLSGEDIDPDPVAGHNHLIHIAWNALSLYELTLAGKITDQRTKLHTNEVKSTLPVWEKL